MAHPINLLLGRFFTLLPRTVAYPRRFFLGIVLAYLASTLFSTSFVPFVLLLAADQKMHGKTQGLPADGTQKGHFPISV